ncbi:MAG: hypothetical protein SGJ24_13300 [Chloroflexota bacterium]|nr:hypothetical protein [Chloroflexota bacterium]
MRRVISFGAYTFPSSVPDRGEVLRTNFGNGVPRTERLPGVDGGFDAYGADAMANEIGAVRFRFVLVADSAAAMSAARDAVMGMASYGRALLTIETSAGASRWTYAKINNIAMPTEHDAFSDKIGEVTIDWQVAYPRWFATAVGSPSAIAASGTATSATVTAGGNAVALPVITIDPGTAISAAGVRVQRLVSAVVVDEIVYGAALLATDVLVIHCKGLTVRKNGVDAYSTAFTALHPAWLRLKPGANTIRVILGVGETASVSVAWDDTWY